MSDALKSFLNTIYHTFKKTKFKGEGDKNVLTENASVVKADNFLLNTSVKKQETPLLTEGQILTFAGYTDEVNNSESQVIVNVSRDKFGVKYYCLDIKTYKFTFHRNIKNIKHLKGPGIYYKTGNIHPDYKKLLAFLPDSVKRKKHFHYKSTDTFDFVDFADFIAEMSKIYMNIGHCNIPYNSRQKWLVSMVKIVRSNYANNSLMKEYVEVLENINFKWKYTYYSYSWNRLIERLKYEKYSSGVCCIRESNSDKLLINKIQEIRLEYFKGTLSNYKINQLTKLGFDWFSLFFNDSHFILSLLHFKKVHGHCDIKLNYEDKEVVKWIKYVRREYKHNRLSEKEVLELKHLGLVLDFSEKKQSEFIEKITEFKKKFGHCNVPVTYKGSLSAKVLYYRKLYREEKLSYGFVKELETLGFEWGKDYYTYFDDLPEHFDYVIDNYEDVLKVGKKTSISEWSEVFKDKMSNRLYKVLMSGDYYPNPRCEYIEDITKDDFLKMRRVGIILWRELETLRNFNK